MASRMSDTWYRHQADILHHIDGETEIDNYAAVSRNDGVTADEHTLADNGAYVAAWVWVPDPDSPESP